MRDQIQISLRIAAAFFLFWSLALVSDPVATHQMISTGPLDAVTHAMLSGLFLGFAILLLLSSSEPRDDITGGMAIMMIIMGAISAFSMAGSHAMPTNIYTVLSLIFVLGMGVYLILGQMQEMFADGAGSRPVARKAPKKKPVGKSKKKAAKKKPARKKVVKKAAKKAKKKASKKKRR